MKQIQQPLKSILKQKQTSSPSTTTPGIVSVPQKNSDSQKNESKNSLNSSMIESPTKLKESDKLLNKKQLFINSIKESVTVSDLKGLYPKSTSIKMKKRKAGRLRKLVQ